MPKITFMGAGSSVFAKNVLGDCMCSDALKDWEYALYDIDATRLEESFEIISAMNNPFHRCAADASHARPRRSSHVRPL